MTRGIHHIQRTALVVDDEPFFLEVLGDFVRERLNMRALLAQDGAAALPLLEAEPVDLVLLDIIMPGMDGLEVLRRIKGRRPLLPVIMVTATSDIDHAITCLREGADDLVRKPPGLDALELAVHRVLGKVRAAETPPPPRDSASERRRATRARLRERFPAKIQLWDANLLDLSPTGALVEHIEPVHVGEIYRLSFSLEGHHLEILARALRAFPGHRVAVARGERRVIHRTGMEFLGVEKDAAELISAYTNRLLRQGSGKVPA